jgi:DNA-binding transcriptional MerR regulator
MLERGFQAKDVMELTNLTYRQIDYWVKSGIIQPKKVKKGSRQIRSFSFHNLVAVRAAMELLGFGLDFSVVKQFTAWIHSALEDGVGGKHLFAIDGDNFTFVSDDPDEVMDLIRGRCILTIHVGQIIDQLLNDIEALDNQSSKDNRQRYTVPKFAGA